VPSTAKEREQPLIDSYDKDNPVTPVVKQKIPPARSKRQLQLMAAMALLAQASGAGRSFHSREELRQSQKLRRYRACTGILDTNHIHGSQLLSLQQTKMEDDSILHAAVNKSPDTFTAVADTGCSETCTNCLADFIPGTMWKLKVPMALGGIAGSLLVTHVSRIHWETIDDFGEVVTFQTIVFYHPDLPGRLLTTDLLQKRETGTASGHGCRW
jgi:hypothetical protein